MSKKLKILALFDGMSGGQIAINKLFKGEYEYYASEIKPSGIKVTQYNYPNTIQIGDVTKVFFKDGVLYTENGNFKVGEIDLLIGGSPCQNFSILNKERLGLEGEKSKLFYEYLRLKEEINPKHFLLENVKMKKESFMNLNKYLKVDGIPIDSKNFSFQRRPRIYWTDLKVDSVVDKNINFQDFKDKDFDYCSKFKVNKTPSRERMWNNGNGRTDIKSCDNVTYSDKVGCLTRKQDRSPNSGLVEFDGFCRYLTRRELELAQTVPIGYTDIVSYNQAQDLLGDGWTIDVIVHILKSLFNEEGEYIG